MKPGQSNRMSFSATVVPAIIPTLVPAIVSTILLPAVLLAFLSGCTDDTSIPQHSQNATQPTTWIPPTDSGKSFSTQSTLSQGNFKLLVAQWQATTSTLKLAGTANNNGERVIIKNATTGDLLASSITNSDLAWTQDISSLSIIPCSISVVSESGTLTSDVLDAPENCNLINNVNNDISRSTLLVSNIIYPDAIIVSPQTDLSIAINESVNFEGAASNIVGTPMFEWSFSGAAPGNAIQNPGKVTFTKPGVYHVELEVTDSRGLSDPTPPMRMITVFDPISSLDAQPIANIDTPVGDQIIMVGDTLNFSGSGSDPASPDPVTFMWDFGGVSPNNTMQNPGDITFDMAGTYTIVLSVVDSVGNIGTAQIMVTVNDPAAANQPPVGMITSPTADLIINPGDSIVIEGQANDPDTVDLIANPISYYWEFDGVIPDLTIQNPGTVTYLNAGVFTIRLTATDSMGLSDPNPPTRVITVQTPAPISSDAPNGEILTPAMDTTIMPGESITFTATGTAAAGNEPLMYIWSFDGVAPNSTNMDTGPITFADPGIYTVTLLVVDATNQVDPTPAVRVITVEEAAPGTPPTMVNMVGHIIMPDADVSILPGDAVSFTGFVDPEINPPYTFLWLFDGAAPNSDGLMTEDIVFSNPGVYSVMFFAIDKDGMFDTGPAMRTVTATDPTTAPDPAPIASITNPAADMTITTGDSIPFEGSVVDVSGNATLEYLWTFGGAADDDTMLTPAPVMFNMAGVYVVTFSATDISTMLSSEPTSIIITVEDPVAGPDPAPGPAAPIAEIIIADGITTIIAGNTIDFMGNSADVMLDYLWTFGGAAPDSMDLSPGPIVFDVAGQYEVVFTVTDNTDPANTLVTTATVTINVMPAGTGNGTPPLPVSNMPQGFIIEPAGDRSITVGGTLQFAGNGVNPIDGDPLNYSWDFGNGTTSRAQVPGIVTFNQVGVFAVTLIVDHDSIDFAPTPAQIMVTVTAADADPAP